MIVTQHRQMLKMTLTLHLFSRLPKHAYHGTFKLKQILPMNERVRENIHKMVSVNIRGK